MRHGWRTVLAGARCDADSMLAWRWPLATVVPLVLLLDLPASLLHAWLNRRDVRLSAARN